MSPAPASGSSQQPVPPAPGVPLLSSGLHRDHLTHTHTCMPPTIGNNKNKSLKMEYILIDYSQ